MENVVNITDKLVIRTLETKIFRLQNEIDLHLKNISDYRTDNFKLISQNGRLKEEVDELKKLLKQVNVEVTYG